jgi:death on curing protein
VEFIHDEIVATTMPFDEPVDAASYRDGGMVDAAVNRPFHTFGGEELHPTIYRKAAVLFHGIACGHAFLNGNKRTAVMALDLFLTANSYWLLMTNEDVYELAKTTVEANLNGVSPDAVINELSQRIENESVSFETLSNPELQAKYPRLKNMHAMLINISKATRDNPLNAPLNAGTPI